MFIVAMFVIVLNWALKLFVGWLAYTIMIYIGAPEWAVITVTAVAAVSTYFKMNVSYR